MMLLLDQYHSITYIEIEAASSSWHTATVKCLVQLNYAKAASVPTWMGDHISMSISGESPLDETLIEILRAALTATPTV